MFVSRLRVSYWGTAEFFPLHIIVAEQSVYTTRFSFYSAMTAIITRLHIESGNLLLVITAQTNATRSCTGFALFAESSKSQLCSIGRTPAEVHADEYQIQRFNSVCAPSNLTQAETLMPCIRKLPGSKFRPNWLKSFLVFINSSVLIPKYYLEIGRSLFLSSPQIHL